jgi:hypothetical protein
MSETWQPPHVVKVRLIGEQADIDAVTAALDSSPGTKVIDHSSGARPNRYDPGVRVYLTVRVGEGQAP